MRHVAFVCPRCRGEVVREPEAFLCHACAARYPVVADIPDFRVFRDPWISLEDDRAKALRVAEITRHMDFEDSARAYWSITPDTPRALAERYVAHVVGAQQRSREWLETLSRTAPGEEWLELGCGTGDLLAEATTRGIPIVGIDIALRWLVIVRRRPELRDGAVPLVCCCAEALPFADRTFGRVAALGLLEHCNEPGAVLREAQRVLRSGGDIVLRTVNRFSVLSEPHVQVWGVGFVPRRLADRYVAWRSGMRYLHHRPVSRRELRRAFRSAGFSRARIAPARVLEQERRNLGRLGNALVPFYAAARRVPLVRYMMSWFAPLLEASAIAR